MKDDAAASLSLPLEFILPEDCAVLRLDAALALALPHLGLRARRRLWNWCRVLVNGRERPPGFQVAGGDAIRVEAKAPPPEAGRDFHIGPAPGICAASRPCPGSLPGLSAASFPPPDIPPDILSDIRPDIRLVELTDDFAVFAKPCGLHSAHIAGSPEASFEALLPGLWPELHNRWHAERGQTGAPGPAPPLLLTRLDRATSGLLLAARHTGAATAFRRDEARGLVSKTYLALLSGPLPGPLLLDRRLLTENSARTFVAEEADPDPARHTRVEPLVRVRLDGGMARPEADGPLTLVRVFLRRGARHQIRAHLAGAGFSLAGEWLYGGEEARGAPGGLFLHHAELKTGGLTARCLPKWLAGWPEGLSGL